MKSSMHEVLLAAGGRFDESAGPSGPSHFGDPLREYAAARHSAALLDRSLLSKLEFRGRDRAKFVHNLCTNDIKGLAAGTGCEAFLTNVQGKVLAYVRILVALESIWLDTKPCDSATLLAHFDRYLIMEKVEIADRTTEYAQFFVVGPKSKQVVSKAAGAAVPELPDLGHADFTIAGHVCQLIQNQSLGLPGYEIRLPASNAANLWRHLSQTGEPLCLTPMGEQAYEILRVEAGLPLFGRDMDDTNLPQEIGRDKRCISFTKGCYLGQETVARIDALGHVNRHLVGLKLLTACDPPPYGAAISSGDKSIGLITSAIHSPFLSSVIALGFVRRGFEKPGTKVTINDAAVQLPASVSALPFATG